MTYCNLFRFFIQRLVQLVGQFQPAKSSFHVFSNECFVICNYQYKDTNKINIKKQVMKQIILNILFVVILILFFNAIL